jgi:hypothetical protein
MKQKDMEDFFTKDVLDEILPPGLSDDFFEALYGDAKEGAYDISLAFNSYDAEQNLLSFDVKLQERLDKCLACNLTYGLPEVFTKHPLIDMQGIVEKIFKLLGSNVKLVDWKLGHTETPAAQTHIIPLRIRLG